MRILYVSQYFPPEMGAPAARVSELAQRWVAAGHQVCVLTGFPHHPTGVVPSEYRGQWLRRETYRGVDVLRCYVYATPNRGVGRRVASYVSFAASSAIIGALAAEVRSCDVVVATSPQFLCALSGWWLSRRLKVPYVLEVRDLWPESIVAVGVWPANHPIVRGLARLEQFVYRQANLLVGVTDSFAQTWVAQGIPPEKVRVVKNGVDLPKFVSYARDRVRAELGLHNRFVVMYVGTLGLAHGLETLLLVADRLRDSRAEFVFVGEGARRQVLESQARALKLRHVRFIGEQPRDRVPDLLAASDMGVVMLRRDPLFEKVIPSKLFEIMGAARPVLLAVDGEARSLVHRAGCGYIAATQDVDQITEQIRQAMSDPAEACRRGFAGQAFVRTHFDRDAQANAYLEHLGELVGDLKVMS